MSSRDARLQPDALGATILLLFTCRPPPPTAPWIGTSKP